MTAVLSFLPLKAREAERSQQVVCVNPPKQQAGLRHDFLPPLPPGKIAEATTG
jgi:hypothetical protein